MLKIIHLHLKSNMGNKLSLTCHITDNRSLKYQLWGGWSSSGTPNALSNLGCDLPIEKHKPDQDIGNFKHLLKRTINEESFYSVVHEVKPVVFS